MVRKKRYVYSKDDLNFVEYKLPAKKVVSLVLKIAAAAAVAGLGVYILFSLLVYSPDEKRLRRENAYVEKTYDDLLEKSEVLHNTVKGLEYKDKGIYEEIFNSAPPDFVKADTAESYARLDSLYEDDLVRETFLKGEVLGGRAGAGSRAIAEITSVIDSMGGSLQEIPSIVPLRRFSVASTGASVGKKVNPFLKTLSDHEGIDLLAPVGTDVLASASGTVSEIKRSIKGFGNSVKVTHSGGIVTFYGNMNDILVRSGQRVSRGDVIGRVGNSGTSFAPHLHYGVFKDGSAMDPVDYFFADLDGKSYREMMMISANTGQSLD